MITLKNTFAYAVFFILLISVSTEVSGQNNKPLTVPVAETMQGSEGIFTDLFEVWNIGNLHVYAQERISENPEYYFVGEKIGRSYWNFFPAEVQETLTEDKRDVFALGVIKGEDLKPYYLVRQMQEETPNTIVMYEKVDGRLVAVKTLAYINNKEDKTIQQDSWIQDVNGDTRLDIISKTRTINKKGKIKRVKTRVWLQQEDGKFKKERKANIDPKDYIFQEISR